MLNTYELRLTTFKAWPYKHQRPTPTFFIAADFEYQPTTKYDDFTSCPTCGVGLIDWSPKDDPLTKHIRRSLNCKWLKRQREGNAKEYARQQRAHRELQQQAQQARREKEQQVEAARIAKEATVAFACRRCPARFPSNTQLHKHIDEHHAKKLKFEPSAPATPPATPLQTTSKSISTSAHTSAEAPNNAPASTLALASCAPLTPPSTPSQKACKPTTSRHSRLPRPTFTSPLTSPQTPHIQSTNHVTKPPYKPYMTIDDLYTMFEKKRSRKCMNTIQTSAPSPPPRQARITSYFKPVAPISSTNQRPASSKSSPKLKSFKNELFKAPTPPPPTSTPSTRTLPNHKPARPKTSTKLNAFKNELSTFSARSTPSAQNLLNERSRTSKTQHTCRRCKSWFAFNNLLHSHLHECHTFRRLSGIDTPRRRDLIDSWRKP